jgi:threonine synthase
VWRFADSLEPHVPAEFRVTLGEGGTPLVEAPDLGRALGLERLWLKREDLNPSGSHKARGAAFQVSALAAAGQRTLVISSSGNAALAAAAYSAAAGLRLVAILAPGTPPAKLAALRRMGAALFVSERALGLARDVAEATGWPNLRPSVDPLAVPGYLTLGWELAAELPERADLFLFVASGATMVGLFRSRQPSEPPLALHAVQSRRAAPVVAAAGDSRPSPPDDGAGPTRLGARFGPKTRRVGEVVRALRATGGGAWSVSDAEADRARALLAGAGFDTGLEGAAALATAELAARHARCRRAVVVLTGAASGEPDFAGALDDPVPRAADAAGVLDVLARAG